MIDDKIQHTKERTTNKKHNTKKKLTNTYREFRVCISLSQLIFFKLNDFMLGLYFFSAALVDDYFELYKFIFFITTV